LTLQGKKISGEAFGVSKKGTDEAEKRRLRNKKRKPGGFLHA